MFEIESLPERNPRADMARAVVHAGWNLLELKSTTYSLEEVYLMLTGANAEQAATTATGGVQ